MSAAAARTSSTATIRGRSELSTVDETESRAVTDQTATPTTPASSATTPAKLAASFHLIERFTNIRAPQRGTGSVIVRELWNLTARIRTKMPVHYHYGTPPHRPHGSTSMSSETQIPTTDD